MKLANRIMTSGVANTLELQRILRLPRRPSDFWYRTKDRAPGDLTYELRSAARCDGGCSLCANEDAHLWPIQSAMLIEARFQNGLFAPVCVGGGKTLVTLLLPWVLNSRRAVLLTKSSLLHPLKQIEIPKYSRHYKLHPNLDVVSYHELSSAGSTGLLEELKPDLVIADEAHLLRHRTAARVKRFLRYMNNHPECRFVALSGTMTTRSILDYAHLIELSLRKGSPLPNRYYDLQEWAAAIDISDNPLPPGKLSSFCQMGEDVRSGFRRRLVETRGVVATSEGSLGTSLILERRDPRIPNHLVLEFEKLYRLWSWDDEELEDAMAVARVARQLAMGFYYKWMWPEGRVDCEWLDARNAWHREVRNFLRYKAKEGLDSPLLLARAAQDGRWKSETWAPWEKVKDRPIPDVEPVWISFYLLEDIQTFLITEKPENLIIWYEHRAVGEILAERMGLPLFGGNDDSAERLSETTPKTHPVIVCSIKAHGTGRNLQAYSRNLILCPPANGATFEQCLDSRTEILTRSGWIGIDDPWDPNIEIAAYSISDSSIHWSYGKRIERLLGDEDMFGISNPHLDIRVTANHRMIYQRIRRFGNGGCDGFIYEMQKFVEAKDIGSRGRIPISGVQSVTGIPLTEAELIFLGLFMTDGNLNKNLISISQSERYPEIVSLIENTLRECRFKFGHRVVTTPTNFGERGSPLHVWSLSKHGSLRKEGDLRGWKHLESYIDKTFPYSLDDMSSSQLRSFLYGMWAGNGAKTQGTYEYCRYTPSTMNICVSRKLTAERIQSLCVRRGLRCNISQVQPKLWMLYISEDLTWTVIANMNIKRPVWRKIDSVSSERVWCVEVDSGAIVTRRNGKVAIVGNCIGRTHRPGQKADEVICTMYLHTTEFGNAFDRCVESAKYIEQTTGQKQKLLYATKSGVGW